jgi:antitoxin (DNA-binding transcriptional repressor) of toxin-antitoxin stability system
MKTVELSKATAPLAEYARTAAKDSLILTSDGKPVAALVAIENADWETVTLSTHPEFIRLINASRARQATEGGISTLEMRKRLGLEPDAGES